MDECFTLPLAAFLDEFSNRTLDLRSKINFGLNKTWLEPGKHSQEIVSDQNLAVAAAPAANSNGRHPGLLRNGVGDWRRNQFEDHSENPRLIQSQCILHQLSGLLRSFPLYAISALLPYPLRQHPNVTKHLNPLAKDRLDHGKKLATPLRLNPVRASPISFRALRTPMASVSVLRAGRSAINGVSLTPLATARV